MNDTDIQEIKHRLISIQTALGVLMEVEQLTVDKIGTEPNKADLAALLMHQIIAVTFKPGEVWSLNCGVSLFKKDEARDRFNILRGKFEKILGSFMFLK